MTEQQSHRSHLRNASGPQAVDPRGDRDRSRTTNRRQREHSDREKSRSKKSDSSYKASSKKSPSENDSDHRRKRSSSSSASLEVESPTLELQVVRQPAPVIQLGMTVEKVVIITSSSGNINTSGLLTVTSLVVDIRGGERVALEAGYLVGQKNLDSIHALPPSYVEKCVSTEPYVLPLGYSSFSHLLIRQHGLYRIRTTLMKMEAGGATTLHSVDSDPIKVERPAMQRRPQPRA